MKLKPLDIIIFCLIVFFLFGSTHISIAFILSSSDQDQEVRSSEEDQAPQSQKQTVQESDERIDKAGQKEKGKEEGIEEEETIEIADPLYVWNKGVYYFNDKLYFWLLKPVAQGYSAIFPEGVRFSISNFFYNLTTPVRFLNSLLQLKMKSAGNELIRFVVNSSVGVGGLGDFAKDKLDIKRHDEDLGQTFGHYGVGHGFYIMWPFIGPSSLRDTVGLIGDAFLDPVNYITPVQDSLEITASDKVNDTSLHIGDYEDFKKSAIDPYIAIRDAYVQNREKKVKE
jgi:phospholipid-binding lipoprotein MlaA